MSQAEGQNAKWRTTRYLIVEILGTQEDALAAVEAIETLLNPEYTANPPRIEEVRYFGCVGCGCQGYLPEPESCDDELCGHNCETCGCFKNCVECGNPVGNNETYCSGKCRIQGQDF